MQKASPRTVTLCTLWWSTRPAWTWTVMPKVCVATRTALDKVRNVPIIATRSGMIL